ncbi:tetratricopeptide repeat protein [Luteolibacter sp. SL250]|uniref:tetratricopeptide repeat protein n=1 Tax=Luteolibacter sp. SL250 TaxID=2995170 RepID=UPI00226D4E12|nr:tetratricopeptide repeat protein [Luteolibacter sp. SL250]WAC19440.1 tetratricopeptide repeat protein [Luteolibacter sp. SL250]
MNRALPFLFLTAGALSAQPPRAETVNEVLEQDPGEAFFQRCKNRFNQGVQAADVENRILIFQHAGELLENYISQFPNHKNTESAYYFLGESLYQSGVPDAGRQRFSTLLNRYPDGPWAALAAYKLGLEHYNRREYAFAAPLFERYALNAAKPSERPRGNYNAGDCYRLLGRDREALAAFRKVIDDPAGAPMVPKAKFFTGKILLKSGDAKQALPLFEEVAGNSGNPNELRGDAALAASDAAAKLEQHDVADKYLQFILTQPGMEAFRADAQITLMRQAFDRKEYKKVIEIYQRNSAPAEGEREAARLTLAARAYMENKQPQEAMQLFREVEKLVPESNLAFLAAYYRLHCFFQIEGRHVPDQVDGFLQIYRRTRPPDDPKIQTVLLLKAETLFSSGKNAEAAKAFAEIDANAISEQNRPGLLYNRGWCMAEAGDLQGAIRSLSEFIAKYPKDERAPSALMKRAQSYAQSGDNAKAIADFDQLTAEGMPDDLSTAAWIESARLRRTEDNVPDMIVRYKGLLAKKNINDNQSAEANFRIGWGLVKQNTHAEAIAFLEKARALDAKTYGKHSGLLLCMAYGAMLDAQKLSAEINLAIEGGYNEELADQTIQWAGMQAYNGGDYKSTARFLNLIANPEEPRETAKEIWRYLGKARFETGDYEGALTAANNVLAVEDNASWKADGLVDKGRALLALDRIAEARVAANESEDLHPTGRTSVLLGILNGDLFDKEGALDRAAGAYNRIVQFAGDAELKPLALHKLIQLRERTDDKAGADKLRQQLQKEFPNWKPPGNAP